VFGDGALLNSRATAPGPRHTTQPGPPLNARRGSSPTVREGSTTSSCLHNPSSEIPRNLRADPFSNRDGNAIPDHSVSVRVASRESECVRDSLQPGVFSNRVGPRAARKPPVRNQPRAQVFGVMRNAGWCDIPALGIADNRAITILAGKAATNIVRDVRCRIGLKYFGQCDSPFRRGLAPCEVSPTPNYD
jgi:hypothetical protein